MEQIFVTLQGIIVRALPTFFLFILLHWFLKKVLFQPMERVMEERRRKTQGAVADSEAAFAGLDARIAAYQASLDDARAAIYQEQELGRKKLSEQQSQAVEAAKQTANERVTAAKAELGREVESAKVALNAESDRLAEAIASAALAGGVQ